MMGGIIIGSGFISGFTSILGSGFICSCYYY